MTRSGERIGRASESPKTGAISSLLTPMSCSICMRSTEVPACFAVVGSAALPGKRPYHAPEQIRRIHDAGHEVASHSHRHEWLPALSRQALRETLSASKDALEQCIGAPIATFVPPVQPAV